MGPTPLRLVHFLTVTWSHCDHVTAIIKQSIKLFYTKIFLRAFSEKGGWFLGERWQESRSFLPVNFDFP